LTSSRAGALRISQNQTSNEIAGRCLLINIHGSESDREIADGEQLKQNVLWGLFYDGQRLPMTACWKPREGPSVALLKIL